MVDRPNAGDQRPSGTGRGVWRFARWFLRWWIILPLLLLITYLVALSLTEKQLAAELARVEASGGALRLADLAPRVPAGEANAADVYQRAFDLVTADSETIDRTRDDPDLARQVLATHESALRLLEQASQIRTCAFPVDWDDEVGIAFPHFARMRESARLLAARARLRAQDGHPDEALADCAAIFRISEHAQREPILIGALVGFALNGIAMAALEQSLSHGGPSPAACQDLFEVLGTADPHAALEHALQGEIAVQVQLYEHVRAGHARDLLIGASELWPQALLLDLYRTLGRPLLNLDEVSFLRAMEQNIAALDLPPGEAERRMAEIAAEIRQLPVYQSVLANMIMPVFTRGLLTRDRAAAETGAAQIALALTAYHGEHRRYPDTLADLAAEGWTIPDDPLTGRPYIYRREGDGFVVYSLGPDMTDDGGLPPLWKDTELSGQARDQRMEHYDITFRVER